MPITRSTRHKPKPRTAKNRLGLLWLFGWLTLGGALLFHGLGGRVADIEPQAVASVAPIETSVRLTKPIEEIQVGDRVAAKLPEASNADELVFQQPHWDVEKIELEQWRRIELTAVEGKDHRFDIVLLRPVEWLQQTKANVGGSIHLYLPEQGLDGPATVQSIDPCPQIQDGNGEVVTGTITHIRTGVLELKLSGINKPLGVTNNHPVYSVDRLKFLPAGDLKIGETLKLLNGTTRVESITSLPGNHRVYNLEVHTRHVYHVSSNGVLVHNACPGHKMTPDMQALKELVDEASLKAHKALKTGDAEIILDWAKEVKYPGWRADIGDVTFPSKWKGRKGHPKEPHIHIPGVGSGHIPVDPGVIPWPRLNSP